MNRQLRKELTRIKNEIKKCRVDYAGLYFIQEHKQDVLDYGDIQLAEWAGITENEWDKGQLNQE